MVLLRNALCLSLLVGAFAASNTVTPIDKVIDLIEGMKKEVEKDGSSEAKAYDEFACFCKDTTEKKSNSVKKGTDQISKLSANIADKTQEKKDDSAELVKRKREQEESKRKLEE